MKNLLLAPKRFWDFEPGEYLEYVKSLFDYNFKKRISEIRKQKDFKVVVGYFTKRGALTIRVKRKPKKITKAELLELCETLKMTQEDMIDAINSRGIKIVETIENNLSIDSMRV